jgi:RecG-like helicase
MRTILASVLVLAATALLVGGGIQAGEKAGKEVTIKGTVTCAKCDLGKEKTCMTVVVAKNKEGKETVYYFDPTSSKKYHGKICTEAHQGAVTGTVSKKGDKSIITVKKVDYK